MMPTYFRHITEGAVYDIIHPGTSGVLPMLLRNQCCGARYDARPRLGTGQPKTKRPYARCIVTYSLPIYSVL